MNPYIEEFYTYIEGFAKVLYGGALHIDREFCKAPVWRGLAHGEKASYTQMHISVIFHTDAGKCILKFLYSGGFTPME